MQVILGSRQATVALGKGQIAVVIDEMEFGPLQKGQFVAEAWGGKSYQAPDNRQAKADGRNALRLHGIEFQTFPPEQRFGNLSIRVTAKANTFSPTPLARKAASLDATEARLRKQLADLQAKKTAANGVTPVAAAPATPGAVSPVPAKK